MMPNDRLVWVFGCERDDVRGSHLVRFWEYCVSVSRIKSYLVIKATQSNFQFLSAVKEKMREYVLFYGTRKHKSVLLHANLLFAESREIEIVPSKVQRPLITPPLVLFPSWDADPVREMEGAYAENSVFRYVVSDSSIYWYLILAKGFKPYQLVFDAGLYSAAESEWTSAAKKFLDELCFAQKNGVVFLGFALTHVGGTPMATHALAEGLLERGFQVSYITLRKSALVSTPPGIPITSLEAAVECAYAKSRLLRIVYWLIPRKRKLLALCHDPGTFKPECGRMLRIVLKRIRCKTIVSTRDSLHEFLAEASAIDDRDKVYFFHCSSKAWRRLFGGAIERIKKLKIEKAVFVTESNRISLMCDFDFRNYAHYLVLGNGVPSSRMIDREQVCSPKNAGRICACWLVRLEPERRQEFENLFHFAETLKSNGVSDIQIDVYGNGSCALEFQNEITKRDLQKFISYCGVSNDVRCQYAEHDAVVDFTRIQSFGMVYIEAILNGRMVFCYRNEGSSEVLRDIPESYFESDQELLEKLHGVRNVSVEHLKHNYDLIAKRFSRQAVARRFVEFLEDGSKCK